MGLNVILAITVTALWMERQRVLARYAAAATPKVEPSTDAAQAPTVVTQVVQVIAPFRWSGLVSTNDYRAFVANLRASGCPEQTVEEIVDGDVDYIFSLERRREGIDGSTPGRWSDESQTKLAAYLLGQALPETVAERPPTAPHVPDPARLPLETPLVMQDLDLKALGLSDDQMQTVASVREDFLSQTGGSNQDTNDPAYRRQWRVAQQAADNTLMAQLGNDVYNKIQMLAYQNYLLNQQ